MTPEQYQRLHEAFARVCEADPAVRSAVLESACADAQDLAAELQAMIARHDQAPHEAGEVVVPPDVAAGLRAAHEAQTNDAIPESFGPYRIVRHIASGSMGDVYEAEQASPRRRVAIKAFRPGLASRQLLLRFEYESQILGRLNHPGIASIFEAGSVDTKYGVRSYFAMEFIDGEPIDAFVQRHKLSVIRRIELFLQVCDAVQYAHAQGVIHRDLKPDNILVASGEDGPHPKVLDFGVARATDADVRGVTIHTEVGQLLGTVSYMSPEQAAGETQAIDIRSDVYALGVIGFELLAGVLPYGVGDGPMLEALRIIREAEPRHLSQGPRDLDCDLDTIFAKALDKEPARRYQSVVELAADLRRFLNDEPILARPPTVSYQLRKFARRNRTLVGGATLTLIALILGVAGTTYGLVTAERRLADAVDARGEAEAVISFFESMIESARPDRMGREVLVREMLDEGLQFIERDLLARPVLAARMQDILGESYRTWGEFERAEALHLAALERRRSLLGDDHPDTIKSRGHLAVVYLRLNRFDEAGVLFNEAQAAAERALSPDHPVTLTILNDYGVYLLATNQFEVAIPICERAFTALQRLYGGEDRRALTALDNLAQAYGLGGRLEECENLLLELVDTEARVLGTEDSDYLFTIHNFGRFYFFQGKHEEAERYLIQALDGRRRVLGDEHLLTLSSQISLAQVLLALERPDDAEPLLLEALPTLMASVGQTHKRTISTLKMLANLNEARGDEATTETYRRQLPPSAD